MDVLSVDPRAANTGPICCGGAGARCGGKNDGDDLKPVCGAGNTCRGRTCRRA